MNQLLRPLRSSAFRSPCHSTLRSLLLMLAACLLLLPGLSRAQITSPVPGTTLTANTVSFQWNHAALLADRQYYLDIGTTLAGSQIRNNFGGSLITANSVSVTATQFTVVPRVKIYVRLWTYVSASSQYKPTDFVYNVDVDDDGILDIIDPNPGVADAKINLADGADYTMKILGSRRVASLKSSTLFAYTNGDPGAPQVQEMSKRIYEKFGDSFDFLFVAANRAEPSPSATAAGIHSAVSNSVTGIGKSTFNAGAIYGTGPTGKLQSFLYLASREGLEKGPGLHELMHRWGNSLNRFIPTSHWGYSSLGGTLGGWKAGSLESNVDGVAGRYRASSPVTSRGYFWSTSDGGGNGLPYSQLELYLMGILPPSGVAPVQVAVNGANLGVSGPGKFTASSIATYSISDIINGTSSPAIAGYGARVPDSAASQKSFRAMLVVLTENELTNQEWAAADESVRNFSLAGDEQTSSYNFWEATGGVGSLNMAALDTTLNPIADLSALTLSAGALSPAFQRATLSYTVTALGATSTTVTATRVDPAATMQVRTNGGSFTDLNSGVPSAALTLIPGLNAVEVKVTNGSFSRTYSAKVLTVPQFPAVPASLGGIPDNTGASKDVTFNVNGLTGTVTGVQVEFTLSPEHPYWKDLTILLISPDNTQHTILRVPSSQFGYALAGPYVFSDSAAGVMTSASLTGGVPVPSGTYRTQNNSLTATSMNSAFNSRNPNDTWTLRFTDSGTTGAFGGVSAANLYVATAAPANIAPTNIAVTSSSILENNAVGATVGTLSATDPDAGQTHTFSFVSGGTDNGSFTIVGTSLKLTPAANFEVKSSYSILLRATDNGIPAASFDKAFTITVTNVNEMPSFTKGADRSHPAGTSTAQSVTGWATAIDDGDSTVSQGLTFNVSNNNAALFSTSPAIASNGTLTYTPNGTAGTSTVTVTLTDDASINSTAALTTSAQTFTITVAAAPVGGTIVWGAAQNWTGGATQVLANGVRHSAVCFVPSVDTTVNGVVFDRATVASGGSPILFANSSPVQITSGLHMALVNAPSGFGSFGTLVSYGNFHLNAASTITIGSLVVGQDYQVQIFMPYWDQFYPTSFASPSGASLTLNCGRVSPATPSAAQFVTGTFTATATSHVINYRSAPAGSYAGVSAVSVRRTSVSTNADLSALTTTAGPLTFAAATTSYTANVPNATSSVTVTPTVADANATVTVSGTSVSSGNASGNISLTVGANAIPVVVTAQSGATKTYTLNVTRAAPALTGVAITPTSVITTSQWINPDAGVRGKMIDGSGLSGGGSVLDQTHDQLFTAETMWHAGPDGGGLSGGTTGNPPTVASQAVEFDLGANYNLTGAHIWNMNQQNFIGRGVKDVQILVSSATTGTFTPLITTIFTQGTGNAGLAAQVVPFTGANNVRRVRFAIQSAWSGAATEYVGLSEVRFQGTAAVGNLPPTITAIPNLTMLEDGWDTSTTFTVADPNPGSTLTVTQSSDNTALIRFDNTDYYTIAKDGDSYNYGIAPVENMTGTANVTITVSDGTLTATRVFVVTVTGVNDRPTFTYNAPAPISVAAGSGLQTRPGIATGISPGPANESSQTVDFVVTNDNNPLFSIQPAIDAAGNLSFTPGNTAGTATVSFQARDSGGTANGGVNASSPVRTFTIELTASTNQVNVDGTNPGAIPDNDATGREIAFNVTGRTGTVSNVTVQFALNPIHPFIGDLSVQLIAPDGTVANVLSWVSNMPGRSADFAGPYVISDTGTTSLTQAAGSLGQSPPAGVAVPAGTYRAANQSTLVSLSTVFGGKTPNGTWKLKFVDGFSTDTGTVSQASLTLTTAAAAAAGRLVIQPETNGHMTLSLTEAAPNANYDLIRSTNLQNWTLLQSKTTNGSGATTHTDTAPPAPRAFYRYIPRP